MTDNDRKKEAIKKAMNILLSNDKSEQELRDRLTKAEFPEDCVEAAIEYCKSFGYIDDRRIVESYILSQSSKRSRREIEMKLQSKGIDRNMIEDVYYSLEDDETTNLDGAELEAAKKVYRKKLDQGLDPEVFNDAMKIKAALYNKGFSERVINQLVHS